MKGFYEEGTKKIAKIETQFKILLPREIKMRDYCLLFLVFSLPFDEEILKK